MSFLNSSSSDVTLAPSSKTTETVLPDWYTNYAMQVLANQQRVSSTPYSTYGGPRVADFTPDQQRAFELTRQVARPEGLQKVGAGLEDVRGSSAAGAASPWLNRAGALSGVDAASPNLEAGAGYLAHSTDPTGLSLATPFLGAASGKSVDDVASYMDPYQSQVVDRFGDLAARQVREKLLPELTDRFIAAGQFEGGGEAPSRFGLELGRGVRDIQESTAAQQAQLMSQGYQGALSASAADKARAAGLAATAGGLGQEQQKILAGAGTGLAGIGGQLGSLTADQQRILASIGATTGQLTTADQQTRLQALQQEAALAKQRQDMGITGAGALSGVGAQQQQLEQANLNTAYEDYLRQQGYDQTQIDNMTKTLQGVQPAVPKGQLENGYGPVTDATRSPSTLQQLAAAAGTVLSVI